MLMLSELQGYVMRLIIFRIFFRYGTSVPSFIIVEYLRQILGWGALLHPPPRPWEVPKRPILNSVNTFFFKGACLFETFKNVDSKVYQLLAFLIVLFSSSLILLLSKSFQMLLLWGFVFERRWQPFYGNLIIQLFLCRHFGNSVGFCY